MLLLRNDFLTLFSQKGALTAKGIDKLVEEAREDHKESDVLYMNKKP